MQNKNCEYYLPDSCRVADFSQLEDALFYGKNPFTSLRQQFGKVLFLKEHLSRLKGSAKFFKIGESQASGLVEEIKFHLTQKSTFKWTNSYIRVTLLLGKKPSFFLCEKPLELGLHQNPDMSLCFSRGIRSETLRPAFLKLGNYVESFEEISRAQKLGFSDVIFLDEQSKVCESSIYNIFILKDQCISTPPVSSKVLSGIMRQKLLEFFQATSLNFKEQEISSNMLLNADEVWLTNAVRGMIRVTQVENRLYKKNETYTKLKSQFNEYYDL